VAWHWAQAGAAGGERAAATRAITALLATPGFAEADAARALLATLRRG